MQKKSQGCVGAEILQDCLLNSTAMTTAVQPSELVFEFASNGMDEINQVTRTPLLPLNTWVMRKRNSRVLREWQQSRQTL